MSERKPAEVYCLASFVAEEMLARNWTTHDIAARLSDKIQYGIRVLGFDLWLANGTEEGIIIDDDLFNDLATAFEVNPDYFRNLHQLWLDNPEARQPFDCPESVLSECGPPP